jgi:hypothetical protein
MSRWSVSLLSFALLASPSLLLAQQSTSPCELTPLSAQKPGVNMFTPQQEIDLGDALADTSPTQLLPIEEKELSEKLSQIGNRLVNHLPQTGLNFRFYLSDAPVANAFSIVGGRVYVTRKIIAFFRTEDELAGVMGHELGHIVTHQQAKLFTRIFHERLGIKEVTDRKDIYAKYNRLLDEQAKHGTIRVDTEENQQEADRIGLEATVRAGYSPQALADFWDRFTENKGKVGSWFSELLQSTPPAAKRYREMVKGLAALPAGCKDTIPPRPTVSFEQWQTAVVEFHGLRVSDSLHNVVWKKALEPPLQDVIHTLKFSPNGKYVLAQDAGNIYVLTHDPFQVLFRVDAYDSYPAQFTPDSRSIVFYDRSLRVEKWEIASQQRSSVNEVYVMNSCFQTLLAPDGKTLACYRSSKELELLDVVTGNHLLERKDFLEGKSDFEVTPGSFKWIYTLKLLNLGFSPDGRYFVASLRNEHSVAFDVVQRQEIPLTGALKSFVGTAFAFITPDRIVGYSGAHGEKSAIVEFPSGKTIRPLDLGGARPTPATHGDYILIRPIKDNPVGILDVNLNQIVGANKQSALDVYDQQYVTEMKNGHLGLYGTSPTPVAESPLPRGSLGMLRAVVVSDDLNWLAISGRGRGAVWAIPSNSRILNLREFRGAYISSDHTLLADFPRHDSTARSIARVSLPQRQFSEAMKPTQKEARQEGPYILATHTMNAQDASEKDKKEAADSDDPSEAPVEGLNIRWDFSLFSQEAARNTVLEVRQIQSGSLLWSRSFPKESPRQFTNWSHKTIVLSWPMSDGAAKTEMNNHPEWKSRFASPKDSDWLFEVLDLPTGRVLAGLVLNTGEGSFFITKATAAGDFLILEDNHDRTLVYSLGTGMEKGRAFGRLRTVSDASGMICLESLPGELEVYDLATMSKSDQLSFAHNISSVDFVENGKRLFVLTSDQSAYLVQYANSPKITAAN